MAEFCRCGSLIINGHCSNKGCSLAVQNKEGVDKMKSLKKTRSKTKSTTKSSKPRMSSKCITYNLYETNEAGEDNALD